VWDLKRRKAVLAEEVGDGPRLFRACEVMGITVRTYRHWRKDRSLADTRRAPPKSQANGLGEEERERIMTIATQAPFRGCCRTSFHILGIVPTPVEEVRSGV
jgi:putative transposase